MIRIDVKSKSGNYPVIIGLGLLQRASYFFKKVGVTGRCVLICNKKVYSLYGETLINNLENETNVIIVGDGEKIKSLETAKSLYDQLIDLDINRDATIIALGGGVTGDLAGYVAATYLRGINLVQIPTSLIAQIDSSIGGKVGVNYQSIKNAIGSFYSPKLVLTDIQTLRTLPESEFNNGMAEVIKSAVIRNKKLFHFLKTNHKRIKKQEPDTMLKLVTEVCKIKVNVVMQDERETSLRKILNFGHTFGHPLEMLYNNTHGEAVAIGMNMAAKSAEKLGVLKDNSLLQQLRSLLKIFSLPTEHPQLNENYWSLLLKDKKRKEKMIFILPERIGRPVIINMNIERIRDVFETD